jgi:hypothetical protein
LDGEVAVSEGAFLIDPAHAAPFRRQRTDPNNVTSGHVAQHVQVVVSAGEPSHRNGTVKPDCTRPDRIGNVREILKATHSRNQVPRRLR